MTAAIDYPTMVASMLKDKATFPTITTAIVKAGPNLMSGHLKQKGMTLDIIRNTRDTIGDVDFVRSVEVIGIPGRKAILKKVDPNNRETDDVAIGKAIIALARCEAEPLPRPEKPAKRPAAKVRRSGALGTTSAAAAKETGTVPQPVERNDPPAPKPRTRKLPTVG